MDIKTERSYVDLLENFEAQIGKWAKEGKTPILLIDEAHKLRAPAFDFLHHVMNFVTDKKLLIVIILAGQEELVGKIRKRKELRSRMQAVSLDKLSEEETAELVKWRWRVASKEKDNLCPFNNAALKAVREYTLGLPRDICSLCNRSLQFAFAEETKKITKDLVASAAKSLKFIENGDKKS